MSLRFLCPFHPINMFVFFLKFSFYFPREFYPELPHQHQSSVGTVHSSFQLFRPCITPNRRLSPSRFLFIFRFILCIHYPFALGPVFSLSDRLFSYLSLIGERMSGVSKAKIDHISSLYSDDKDVHPSRNVPLNGGMDGFLGKGAVGTSFRK